MTSHTKGTRSSRRVTQPSRIHNARLRTRQQPSDSQPALSIIEASERPSKRARAVPTTSDRSDPGASLSVQPAPSSLTGQNRSRKRKHHEATPPPLDPVILHNSFANSTASLGQDRKSNYSQSTSHSLGVYPGYQHVRTNMELPEHQAPPETQGDPGELSMPALTAAMREELCDSVFEAADFFDSWLSRKYSGALLSLCRMSQAWDSEKNTWRWSPEGTQETNEKYYKHIVDILNTVGFAARDRRHKDYKPFVDHHAHPVRCDHGGLLKPDIIQCSVLPDARGESRGHWNDIKLVVECKAKNEGFSEVLLQTICYVRAQLGHQYWRKYVYALFLIGTEATFLRVDRCKVIHSPSIDVLKCPEEFANVLGALMLLDQEQLGIHMAFNPILRPDGTHTMTIEYEDRYYEVEETVCRRHQVLGAATVALLVIHRGSNANESLPRRFVVKIAWRESHRVAEGPIMQELGGIFAACEYFRSEELDSIGGMASFRYGEEAKSLHSEEGNRLRKARTAPPEFSRYLCWPSVEAGESLELITDEVVYADALTDITLAIWGLKNAGVYHLNIGPGNIIAMINGESTRKPGERNEEEREYVSKEIQRLSAKEDQTKTDQSEIRRLNQISKLNRRGVAKLIDFHLAIRYNENDRELHTRRTGTRSYMAFLLLAREMGTVSQNYVHDLESLFWFAYYDLAHRRERDEAISPFCQHAYASPTKTNDDLSMFKFYAFYPMQVHQNIKTKWGARIGSLVIRLMEFWRRYIVHEAQLPADEDALFEELIDICQTFKCEREEHLGVDT